VLSDRREKRSERYRERKKKEPNQFKGNTRGQKGGKGRVCIPGGKKKKTQESEEGRVGNRNKAAVIRMKREGKTANRVVGETTLLLRSSEE